MEILFIIFTICLISDGRASMEVTGYSGGEVLIKCMYDPEFTTNKKYFCMLTSLDCEDLINTDAKNMWVTSGRSSMFDDTKSAEFTVKIRELTVKDTGTYQCGVEKEWGTDIYTKVDLNIKKDPDAPDFTSVPSKYALPSLSTSSSVPFKPEFQAARKKYFAIIAFVCVVLLLGGIIFIIVIVYKRCKSKDPETMTETSREITGDHVNDPNVLRFQIKQKKHLPDSAYQSLIPNTNQSDSVYQTLIPNTNQSDFIYQSLNSETKHPNSIYHTLNPPNNQPDSV
ncbi:CMRF35-like molecule 9 [Silurus meridionalis]|uniref:Ig-like domain-containing protein n=1 Tax=Silurus meridionalis TaxID=175797 RepID=A0A8T0C0U4_SILME|nr:CMRF35-like molecule 9 [Silurus meridionalis]KAF7711897.1 hypothetical protein HF521_000908 [Silurus meridionalis]